MSRSAVSFSATFISDGVEYCCCFALLDLIKASDQLLLKTQKAQQYVIRFDIYSIITAQVFISTRTDTHSRTRTPHTHTHALAHTHSHTHTHTHTPTHTHTHTHRDTHTHNKLHCKKNDILEESYIFSVNLWTFPFNTQYNIFNISRFIYHWFSFYSVSQEIETRAVFITAV